LLASTRAACVILIAIAPKSSGAGMMARALTGNISGETTGTSGNTSAEAMRGAIEGKAPGRQRAFPNSLLLKLL